MGITTLGVVNAPPSHAAPGTVSGLVFQDFNGNGTRDPGNTASGVQTDTGFPGVTVTAYGPHNEVVGTDVSGADGTYSIDTSSVADGTPLRIEFSDANGGTAAQLPREFQSSFSGEDNGTSVRFVDAGAENVDFGVLEPEDYADDNAPIMTAIQYAGLRSAPNAAGLPALVANPWVVPANDPAVGNYPGRVDLATYGEVGSIWGDAFDRPQNAAYAAATYKRLSELGPLGLGGIYRIPDVLDPATGAVSGSPGTPEPWLDVTTLGVDVGTVPTTAGRGLGPPDALVRDPNAFEQAGKVGIGGIAIDEEGTTLYFVNLFDRSLYALDITGGATPTSATRIPLNLTAGQRPWAVTVHRDRVYVGYVDTDGDGANPGNAATGNMYVVSEPEATAVAGGAAWRNELTAPLTYTKGNDINNWGAPLPPTTAIPGQVLRWNSWTDQFYWNGDAGAAGFNTAYGWTHIYPQAILGSITFDAEGYITLGFVDRSSVQGGNRQWAPEPPPGCAAPCLTDDRYFETVASGDILIATPDPTLEDNAVVGDRTGANPNNNEGPGGGEFYNDRQNVGTGANHLENTLGGVVAYPGLQEVASTAMDPLGAIRVAGLSWFNVNNGAVVRGYNHTPDPLPTRGIEAQSAPTAPYFQKGGGMGAVSLLTREPPVEIGNRVWLDADFNGRQDPDEPAIQGAPVSLYARGPGGAPVGPALASTTTNAAGEYYFRSDDIPGFNPAATEDATLPYVVVFGRGTGPVTFTGPNAENPGFAGITWADLAFTRQTAAALQRDSNPNPVTGRAPVDVGSPGRNNHTIDAGFNTTGAFQIRKLTEGAPPRPGQTFTFDVTGATNFRGDDVLGSVNPRTFQVGAGQTAPTVPQRLPVGTEITITERNGAQLGASYDPGREQLITVNGGRPLLFTVTNRLTPPSTPAVRTVTSHRRVTPGRPFHDRIHVSGLAGGQGATATAVLYGPFTSRAAATCSAAFQARTKAFHVDNGWNRTPTVRVNAPGVYTWRVTTHANAANTSATHPCGQVAETTVVAKRRYAAPVINGGFSGTVGSPDLDRRVPLTISMPGVGMHATVRTEGVVRRQMRLPGDVSEVGWLRKSADFGDKIGTAVVGGHVSDRHDRPGAMFRLGRAHTGQRITVVRGGTRYHYEVVGKKTYDRRTRLPQRYFATTGRPRLILVSCTDRVVYANGHFHYTRYVVVIAKQLRR
ncbi:SdrD B-like domain-containing protein [Nocardioides sp. CER19]|uniref:SdrD B-like domain-containing protein n=1 Tax=Nocardioides sp. CER19 TaxID=3038538 RepID=UPI002447A810|nr:SdrD B-like domain-containing protein [Nocardioides sp. CER19]MDH2413348.1 SdrD B-like domain-containing protein [Nocardioides sp. CER19]